MSIDPEWTPDDEWEPFVYQARPLNVVDGDTIDFRVDLGFEIYAKRRIRLRGVDTAEISFVSHDSDEYRAGQKHREFVRQWLSLMQGQYVKQNNVQSDDDSWPFILKTDYDPYGKYGRVIASVHPRVAEQDLASALLEEFDDVEVYE